MKIFKKAKTFFTTKCILSKKLVRTPIYNILSDKAALKMRYKAVFEKKINLKAPKTFNEKLQWLKLYNRCPEYADMVDKAESKKYVAGIIGEEYIIPTLGVWDRFDEIDFAALPDRFVLKCTHGSGDVVICKDKDTFDKQAAKNKIERSLRTNYYKISREYPYKNVKPRIIAETYIEDENGELNDYKFFCFNGDVKCSLVATDRFSGNTMCLTFFDRDWNIMPFERGYPRKNEGIAKPANYDEMLRLAAVLSKGIPFLRVDFYSINNKIYFGELTFFPGGGFKIFTPEEWDYKLGEWIELPKEKIT